MGLRENHVNLDHKSLPPGLHAGGDQLSPPPPALVLRGQGVDSFRNCPKQSQSLVGP